ncbi:MAG: histidine kinase [Bacteroidota bacterium]
MLIVLLLSGIIAHSQSYRFKHITAEDGLLSVQRIAMAEDRLGRVWISSDEGLNLFDGYTLTNFTETGDVGLLNNNISTMLCDSKGTVWLSNAKGTQYRAENGRHFITTTKAGQVPIPNLQVLFESPSLGLLAGYRDSCFQFYKNEWRYLPQLSEITKKFGRIRQVAQLKNDLWVWACQEQMILVDVAKQSLERTYDFRYPWCVSAINETSFAAGSFVRDTTCIFNAFTGEQESLRKWQNSKYEIVHGYAFKMALLPGNRLAISTRYNGLYVADLSRRSVINLTHDPGNSTSINSNYGLGVFLTKGGTLFCVGTGLSYTNLDTPQIKTQAFFTDRNGLREDGVKNCFYEESKTILWVGTNNSLVRWNRQTGESQYYSFRDTTEGSDVVRTIRNIAADKLGRIWVGTFTGGIGMLLPNGKFEQITTHQQSRQKDQLPHREILAMVTMPDGNFMLCTNAGFCIFDPLTKKIKTFYDHPKLKKIAGERTFFASIDKHGGWRLASNCGGFYYNPSTDSLIELTTTATTKSRLVYSIATDSIGNTYLAMAEGLHIIEKGSNRITRTIQKQQGLATNLIIGLLTDKSGDVWVIGNRGLARYSPQSGKLTSFDAKDGALQNNHKVVAYHLSYDGEVFIGSEDGLNYFYPNALTGSLLPLRVFVTEAATQDSTFYTPYLTSISLPPKQNNLTLQYLVVDFKIAPYLQYRYMLNGFDTAWVYTGNQRQARYTNLPASTYQFIVQASVNGKEWFAPENPLSITIQKAWWNYSWLQFLLLLLSVAGLYIIYRVRIKQIREKEQLTTDFEKKISQVHMNLLRAQMNPHFIYNSLNSINSFILKSDRANASNYLTKFSRLMRLILDNSRNEWVTLENDLKALDLYIQLEALRFNQAFSYTIKNESITPSDGLLLPPMLLQPFVENAIWHGLLYRTEPGGQLQISVTERNKRLYISIDDNGIGRKAAATKKAKSALQQKSYGIKITEERIATVNQVFKTNVKVTFTDKFTPEGVAIGTTVLLEMDCLYLNES